MDDAEANDRVVQVVKMIEDAMNSFLINGNVFVFAEGSRSLDTKAFVISEDDCNEKGFLHAVEIANEANLQSKSVYTRQALRYIISHSYLVDIGEFSLYLPEFIP